MNWLITGGCGFIGLNLLEKLLLLNGDDNIRILDNLSVGRIEDLSSITSYKLVRLEDIEDRPTGIELLVGDIEDDKICLAGMRGIDIVVHLAGNTGVPNSIKDPQKDFMSNVMGTFNLLESSRINKIQKFVFASSSAPLGDVMPPIREDIPCRPISPYGASKMACEGYCIAYYNSFNVNSVCLRFSNVYGPKSKRKNSVVAAFIKKALSMSAIDIYGNGLQTRDFIYISDLVNAILLAVNSKSSGEIYQIASSVETTIDQLAKNVCDIFRRFEGREIIINYLDARHGDAFRNFSDTSKARKMLNYKAETSLFDGLVTTYKYFKKVMLAKNEY